MNTVWQFISPLDILFLGSNKMIGASGSFTISSVLPWPSVAAGALRSALLVHKGIEPSLFAQGGAPDAELGTPEQPGPFRLSQFQLACRYQDGRIDPLYPAPADLVISQENAQFRIRRMTPQPISDKIPCSAATALLAILPEEMGSKPESGLWLNSKGWQQYLAGQEIDPAHLRNQPQLWNTDFRVGISLDTKKRSAEKGKLFSFNAIAFHKQEHGGDYDVGFLAASEGAAMPEQLMLRFGGEGRGALATTLPSMDMPEPDYDRIVAKGACRFILSTPGLFSMGWLPNGIHYNEGAVHMKSFDLHGVRGELCCAVVPRAEVISGFDLAKRHPKPAQKVAPTGSVYWLQNLQTDTASLRKLAAQGFWSAEVENRQRYAEGFNSLHIAAF